MRLAAGRSESIVAAVGKCLMTCLPDSKEENIMARIPRIGNQTEKSDACVAVVLWR